MLGVLSRVSVHVVRVRLVKGKGCHARGREFESLLFQRRRTVALQGGVWSGRELCGGRMLFPFDGEDIALLICLCDSCDCMFVA